jgi:hypothetical protein
VDHRVDLYRHALCHPPTLIAMLSNYDSIAVKRGGDGQSDNPKA